MYSRTSVARTLMARLPWLFQTPSRALTVTKENPIAVHIFVFGIILGDLLFYIDNGMMFVLNKIAS